MATRKNTTKDETPARDTERAAALRKAYQSAEKRLKDAHEEEWNALLDEEYASAGLEVRRRLTEDEKAAREQAKNEEKRRKLLEKLAALDGVPVSTVEESLSGDPFAA